MCLYLLGWFRTQATYNSTLTHTQHGDRTLHYRVSNDWSSPMIRIDYTAIIRRWSNWICTLLSGHRQAAILCLASFDKYNLLTVIFIVTCEGVGGSRLVFDPFTYQKSSMNSILNYEHWWHIDISLHEFHLINFNPDEKLVSSSNSIDVQCLKPRCWSPWGVNGHGAFTFTGWHARSMTCRCGRCKQWRARGWGKTVVNKQIHHETSRANTPDDNQSCSIRKQTQPIVISIRL